MKFINKIVDLFDGNRELEEENTNMRIFKKKTENKYQKLLEQHQELNEKYISLLENKCSAYDRLEELQEYARGIASDKRALKRELAQKEETINELNQELLKQDKENKK